MLDPKSYEVKRAALFATVAVRQKSTRINPRTMTVKQPCLKVTKILFDEKTLCAINVIVQRVTLSSSQM